LRPEPLRHDGAAMGVNADGRREVLGLKVGASEAERFPTEFLRSLNRRGLRGVRQEEHRASSTPQRPGGPTGGLR